MAMTQNRPMATVHVVGGGLSGLAAASALAAEGLPVKLYEATASAGGRARSSSHATLGTLDHGLHLIPGRSREVFRFLERIGARERIVEVPRPYRFASQETGARWELSRMRPLPAASLADYAELANVALTPDSRTAGHFLGPDNALRDDWAGNFTRLSLHTPLDAVSGRAAQKALSQVMGKLHIVRHSLRDSFIEPALHFLDYHGASVYFSHLLNAVGWHEGRISSLHFARKKVPLAPDDLLILAGPPALATSILPGTSPPTSAHSAITLHFAAAHTEKPGTLRFLTEGPMDMLRYDEGVIRAAIRVAGKEWDTEQPALARRCWAILRNMHPELAGAKLGEWSLWREKRAGHLLDLETVALPEVPHHPHPQCILAGDWLDPGATASLESAVKSGHAAASTAHAILGRFPAKTQSFS